MHVMLLQHSVGFNRPHHRCTSTGVVCRRPGRLPSCVPRSSLVVEQQSSKDSLLVTEDGLFAHQLVAYEVPGKHEQLLALQQLNVLESLSTELQASLQELDAAAAVTPTAEQFDVSMTGPQHTSSVHTKPLRRARRNTTLDAIASGPSLGEQPQAHAVLAREPAALESGQPSSAAAATTTTTAQPQSMAAEPAQPSSHAAQKRHAARARRNRQEASIDPTEAKALVGQLGSGAYDSGLGSLLRRSKHVGLIPFEEQKVLAKQIQGYMRLEQLRKELGKVLKRDPTVEECAAVIKMDPGQFVEQYSAGQQARSRMLVSNYRLIMMVCKRFRGRGVSLEDMVAEGIRGLLMAVERFDPDKNINFGTYAVYWIRHAMGGGVLQEGRVVRLPADVILLYSKVKKARVLLREQLGREPDHEDIAKHLRVPLQRVKSLRAVISRNTSLDVPVFGSEDSAQAKDLVPDRRGNTMIDDVDEELSKELIHELLHELPERDATMVKMYFGLDGNEPMSNYEIAKHFQVTGERVRQIVHHAMHKLSTKQELKNLAEERCVEPKSEPVARKSMVATRKSSR